MVPLVYILTFGLTSVLGLTLPPTVTTTPFWKTTLPKGCFYNGAHYRPGEQFQPDPCTFCQCDVSGRHMCAVADCIIPPCVDAVSKPDQCCPVCPNGPNCRAPDGTLIQQGQTHTTANGAVCKCAMHPEVFWGSQRAICAIQLTPLPTAIAKDDLAVS